MKRRTAVVALITGAIVLAGAGAAFAKGPLSVTITGPGIDQTTDLLEVSANDPVLDLMQESALWGGLRSAVRLAGEPTFELGPSYTVAWVNSVPAGDSPEEQVITQLVYPLAEIGPVIHTPSQVGLGGWGPEVVGWFLGPDSLADTFVALGVPSPPVDTRLDFVEEADVASATTDPALATGRNQGPVDEERLGRVASVAIVGALVIIGLGWAALRRRTAPAR